MSEIRTLVYIRFHYTHWTYYGPSRGRPSGPVLCGFSERALAPFFYELATTEVTEELHVLIP